MSDCPADDLLAAFVSGNLEADLGADVERHLGDCSRCAGAVADAVSLRPVESGPETPLEAGSRLDRYHVLGLAGKGAVGLVYAAYNPNLDRKIALKILRLGGQELEERLAREARAMARVRSPHVVAVYDAATSDGRLYVAMEYVDGPTLRAWLGQRKRTVDEILDAFIQAGRGLAAAHAAGIIHRDFKPDNVLIRPNGQVAVGDFGIALAAADPEDPEGEVAADLHLTSTGVLVGTPAYMAPEQLRGQRVDERSDLFSFCGALHAALYGRHPFPTDNLDVLRGAILLGTVNSPRDPAVPAPVRDAVLAGLRPSPEQRPASMDELLRRLERRPIRRAWLVGGRGGGGRHPGGGDRGPPRGRNRGAVPGRGSRAGVWDDERRGEVRRALAATGSTLAAEAIPGIERALDAYGGRWVAARAEACEATRVRGEQSERMLDLRMACLDERLLRLAALVRSLENATGAQVAEAVVAAHTLPDIGRCADARALVDPEPLRSPAHGPLLALARATLAKAATLQQLGDVKAGLAALAPVLSIADGTGSCLLQAQARTLEGQLRIVGEPKSAEVSFEAAAVAAHGAGRLDLAALAWTNLARVLGSDRAAEAWRWVDYAHAASERAGDDLVRAEVLLAKVSINTWSFRWDKALPFAEEALAVTEAVVGPDDLRLVRPLSALAATMRGLNRRPEAQELLARAAAIQARSLGRDHPAALDVRANQACSASERGRYDEALALLAEVIPALERVHGPQHPALVRALTCLAFTQFDLGVLQEAVPSFRRILAILEAVHGKTAPRLLSTLGMMSESLAWLGEKEEADATIGRAGAIVEPMAPDNPRRLRVQVSRANVQWRTGRCREAVPVLERAVADYGSMTNDGSGSSLAEALESLGRCLLQVGRHGEAEAALLRGLAIYEKAHGPRDKSLIDTLVGLSEVYHGTGDDPRAAAMAERAVAILLEVPQAGSPLAEARLRWARALWSQDRPRARDLGRAALADVAASPPQHAVRREVEAWVEGPR